MCDVFFYLHFLNAQCILAQKMYNAHTIFCQFSNIKNEARSQQPSALGQLVTGEPHSNRISCPRESWSYLLINMFI